MDLIASTTLTGLQGSLDKTNVALDTLWVVAAAILVMFMQAGFAFLEMGFSRQKNAGAVVAKVLTNFAICGVVFWAVGFAFGFGRGGSILGYHGFALNTTDVATDFPGLSFSDVGISAKWWFEVVFCARSLAVRRGTTVQPIWFGWFGFNPGSTLSALSSTGQNADIRFADIVLVTNIAAACGVLGALATIWLRTRKPDIGMACNGAIAALVAITAPSGYVNPWAATIIGFIAGIIVVLGVLAIEKVLDDPVGALSAHGLAGIWGTLSCGLFTDPTLATLNGVGQGGFVYTGSLHPLFAQFVAVSASFATAFAISFATFFAIKATIGLRVKPEEESYGL